MRSAFSAIFWLVLWDFSHANTSTPSSFDDDFKEMEFSEGTSVEALYSLPLVNVSGDNVTANLARILDFYNTELLMANWKSLRRTLNKNCMKDMDSYVKGLKSAKNWALKMDDASGRYTTGWFWGNIYWTGSQSLCEHISPSKEDIVINVQNYSRFERAVKSSLTSKASISPSNPAGYSIEPVGLSSKPPFPVSFFMLRVHINSSFTTEGKIIQVGLCLPNNCSDNDVQTLFEEVSKTSTKVTVNVEAVRSEHGKFNLFTDRTFLTLCVVSVIVAALLIIATSYDFYLEHIKNKKLNAVTTKLDMSMPNIKTQNGKCGLYVVNNNNNDSYNNNIEETLNTNVGDVHSMSTKTSASLLPIILKEMLLSFSMRANIKTICDQNVGADTIPVIHGLKSISMAWVILGHTCIIAFKYSDNMEYRKVVQKEFMFQTISNGAFSVDTFFFTSGLLVSFLYFRSNAKGKLDPLTNGASGFMTGFFHFIGLVAYRFVRLTAPYLFTLGLVEVSMKWFNYNSIFEPPTMDHENCPKYWWRNVLYVNTLFPVEDMCMLWSWYISDDTQFYVIGAVILIMAASHFKSAAALLIIFLTSSWMTTGYIAYSNSHMPGSDDPLALFDKIYDKPWTRLGPYLIGMCTGWLLFKKNCKIRMSKLTITIGWTLSISCLFSLVYGLYGSNLTPWVGAMYSSLSHTAWALGLGWIVVACVAGYGGLINQILSAPILYPFSRITYCAYLVHPILIRVMVMSMDSPLHLGSFVTIIIFMGQAVASFALSFFISVSFEAPVVSMLRIISKIVAIKKSQRSLSQS